METRPLGQSTLQVTPICLGTMTFGEQVSEADAFSIMDRALERGVTFWDTAEMYAVPARQATYGATEAIIGRWLAARPGARDKIVLASKVAGPSRGMPWIREGKGMTAADIMASCEGSLRRLGVDVIDLYQIHWPERHVPAFGTLYYDPAKEVAQTPIQAQLETLAYSPLGVGLLTGKYDQSGITGPDAPKGTRLSYPSVQKQRWGRPEALEAARRYNQLAREHGLTPTQMALAFCYRSWRVASTIIGVTSLSHLDEAVDAWNVQLPGELMEQFDALRWQYRDPGQ